MNRTLSYLATAWLVLSPSHQNVINAFNDLGYSRGARNINALQTAQLEDNLNTGDGDNLIGIIERVSREIVLFGIDTNNQYYTREYIVREPNPKNFRDPYYVSITREATGDWIMTTKFITPNRLHEEFYFKLNLNFDGEIGNLIVEVTGTVELGTSKGVLKGYFERRLASAIRAVRENDLKGVN